ncbi:hypothetical protein SBA1_800006 [Candidatus Sulfotelmatobacter kueseliae]|jgi:hypothetical protein|uniref:Uncharacterized protein n=1 Tax=Candidatus Sulfotelmatobacter kueseliae TaxID=2042962 RepID=A0A2U3L849_9BACT|nr:hypothetical protein SBA1_800006 [Candidatus Sulfotelmatobacter kueseliae]
MLELTAAGILVAYVRLFSRERPLTQGQAHAQSTSIAYPDERGENSAAGARPAIIRLRERCLNSRRHEGYPRSRIT